MNNIIMLSTKNYKNTSSIYANTAKFDKLEVDEAEISNYPSNSHLNKNYYNKEYINIISGNLFNNYYNKVDVDTKVASSYILIMDRLENSHYTINQLNSLYYNKTYINDNYYDKSYINTSSFNFNSYLMNNFYQKLNQMSYLMILVIVYLN